MKNTLDLMKNFAEKCADAYVNNFIDPDGRKVMNQPVVYFNRTTEEFGWCSSLTPLSEGEIVVETLEQGCYGETGDDPQIAREAIADLIVNYTDYTEILEKLEPEEDSNF
jgi:hypothetical protein